MADDALPYKLSTLLFIRDPQDRLLLIKRRKAPNRGRWSPPGGKLEMTVGESPHACARREAAEETGLRLDNRDIHLFATVAERGFEGTGHWLMFLFDVRVRLEALPPDLDEGGFRWFDRAAIDRLDIPPGDHHLVWPLWDRHRDGFVALRADCRPDRNLEIVVEEACPPFHV
jgi:8-oxo-dGTP diphosphatase